MGKGDRERNELSESGVGRERRKVPEGQENKWKSALLMGMSVSRTSQRPVMVEGPRSQLCYLKPDP